MLETNSKGGNRITIDLDEKTSNYQSIPINLRTVQVPPAVPSRSIAKPSHEKLGLISSSMWSPQLSHAPKFDRKTVRTAKGWKKRRRNGRGEAACASMAARFRNPSRRRVSGDFLPKHDKLLLAETSIRTPLFVCFECDSLNGKLGKKKGP